MNCMHLHLKCLQNFIIIFAINCNTYISGPGTHYKHVFFLIQLHFDKTQTEIDSDWFRNVLHRSPLSSYVFVSEEQIVDQSLLFRHVYVRSVEQAWNSIYYTFVICFIECPAHTRNMLLLYWIGTTSIQCTFLFDSEFFI